MLLFFVRRTGSEALPIRLRSERYSQNTGDTANTEITAEVIIDFRRRNALRRLPEDNQVRARRVRKCESER